MKCLSLKQPYAELLVSGKKTIELRKWNTSFRGKFLIHASKNIDKETSQSLGIDYHTLTRGAIIGTAILYGVKQYKSKTELEIDKNKHCVDIKKFGFRKYGFMIKNAQRLSSITYPGKLKFFEVEYPIGFN
jgi:predicted transcriptional regulator